MYAQLDLARMPKAQSGIRFTFVNAQAKPGERALKYALLKAVGFTPTEASAMRDYRPEIIAKRIAILQAASAYPKAYVKPILPPELVASE